MGNQSTMENDLRTETPPRVTGATKARPVVFAISVALVGLVTGIAHIFLFFSHYFHGDASSNYVLATAVYDELSILPKDFYYGTQISLFKAQVFIALSILFGADGYTAFAIGSAVNLALWLLVLYAFLAAGLRSLFLGFLLTLVFLIPLNHLDSDFILGQQSHLSSVVLSIAMVISAHRYATGGGRPWLAAFAVCLFAMAVEAPARAALVAVPLAIALPLGAPRRALPAIYVAMAACLAAGYAINKLVTSHRPVGTDFTEGIDIGNGDEILNGLALFGGRFWNQITGINLLADAADPGVWTLLLYGITLVFLIFIVLYYVVALRELWSSVSGAISGVALPGKGPADREPSPLAALKLTASTGMLVGVFAIASLNPNSIRHVLWAITALKLCLFAEVFRALSRRFGSQLLPALLTLATCLLLSYWLANAATSKVGPRDPNPLTVAVREAAEELGITHVYGTHFWTMMPLNTYIPGISAGVLLQPGGRIVPFQWLARPSWACVDDDVLYVVDMDRAVDEALLAAVRRHPGALKVSETGSTQIWLGQPVWTIPAGVDCGRELPPR